MHSVGDVVYESYNPRKVGKVISEPEAEWPYHCRVKWADGTESVVEGRWMKSLSQLVEQTEKKLVNHKKRLAEGEKI